MRRVFFFLIGISAASVLLVLTTEDAARSARRRRPPSLRGKQAIIFPAVKKDGKEYLGVVFSHASHARFGMKKCTICHNDKVFAKDQSLGINNITMDGIYEGKWCGHCHNGKALNKEGKAVFAPRDGRVDQCVYCHNVKYWEKAESGKGWNPPADVKPIEGPVVE